VLPRIVQSLSIFGLALFAVAGNAGETVSLVTAGASPQMVMDGFEFTEGPAADLEGNVYFTDIPNNKIYRWDTGSNEVTLYRSDLVEPNGMIFDSEGRLVICEMGKRRLVREEPDGQLTVLADSYEGQPLHMPNDLWIDAAGGIYFSDFSGPQAGGEGLQVYYVSTDGNVSRVTRDLVAPNGLIGTPDGKRLYVTDPGAGKTWFYDIVAPGELGPQQLFVAQPTDGMALDEHGNVYLSGEVVTVYSPAGQALEKVEIPGGSTNLTFGGRNGNTLFVAARGAVYSLQMTVTGAATPLQLQHTQ